MVMRNPSALLLEQFPWQETLQWQPTPQQQEQFQRFYGALLAANQGMNLTRITAVPDFWEKHLWDSLRGILPWLQPTGETLWGAKIQQVIDIGSGGGFPGVPVAIARPDWSVTLLEATQKKVKFLHSLGSAVGLANIYPEWGRAESHGRRYDLALIRAVGDVARCCAYGLPLLRSGGILVLYRGQWSDEDTQHLETLLPRYRSRRLDIQGFTTPLSHAQRHCVYLQRQG
ncbi:glucose inhibited division protein B [Thermosynechococcus vestitus BP-1]|uniref:Ribosomal RNA small subunit methyltransferase G n=1 Tax=Thermosynechococcus vestitus (strain NIES-2133 / IAM M-273 / BP-1) TaxID=197221 RepID=RSMG_THEVB|nr:RecName: Full=Ribosomal RNA small subunit methyltransferase G; AltName: Full=16S rRNA 7-methylguanosine methyltransferase; Short=16S rRNA m7G methyltransferase [Thermosynechococcus vestitus BP-1]BAC09256.1 glucose inhibited division protein B [Thermosynechococcus vestitus BP-1]